MSNNNQPILKPIQLREKHDPFLEFYYLESDVWAPSRTIAYFMKRTSQSIASTVRNAVSVRTLGPYKLAEEEAPKLVYNVLDCLDFFESYLFEKGDERRLRNIRSECKFIALQERTDQARKIRHPKQSLLTADPVKNEVSIRVSSDLFNKVNRKCDSLNKKWGIDIKPRDMVLSPDALRELLSEDQENLK